MKPYIKIADGEIIVFKSFETYIIDKLLVDKRNISYPLEMKMAKKLAAISKDQKFWNSIPETKVNSLTYFAKKENLDIIKYLHEQFVKDEWVKFIQSKINRLDFSKESPTLSEQKVGEDVNIKKKINSIKDFLKYG